jgi:putative tryptophan/tyrosine transport system substrate-binding protein
MRRREFIRLIGGVTAWPLVAHAQQPTMPVIGYLDPRSPDAISERLRAFREGLKETGYVVGENVGIEYRWAENQLDRLPMLAADLVRRQVAVITPAGIPAIFAAKAATSTIPIVFMTGDDPVRVGLVASLAQPGGNLTGIAFLTTELAAKRLELLRELFPKVGRVAILVTASAAQTEATLREVELAARTMGLQIKVFNANTSREIDAAFKSMERERADGLFVAPDPFFAARRVQLAHLATRYAVPAIYIGREFAEAGGLISYGANVADAWRQAGVYTGRILKGTKPADLPVMQASKFELIINVETARILDLTVPPSLLARADEVIE